MERGKENSTVSSLTSRQRQTRCRASVSPSGNNAVLLFPFVVRDSFDDRSGNRKDETRRSPLPSIHVVIVAVVGAAQINIHAKLRYRKTNFMGGEGGGGGKERSARGATIGLFGNNVARRDGNSAGCRRCFNEAALRAAPRGIPQRINSICTASCAANRITL